MTFVSSYGNFRSTLVSSTTMFLNSAACKCEALCVFEVNSCEIEEYSPYHILCIWNPLYPRPFLRMFSTFWRPNYDRIRDRNFRKFEMQVSIVNPISVFQSGDEFPRASLRLDSAVRGVRKMWQFRSPLCRRVDKKLFAAIFSRIFVGKRPRLWPFGEVAQYELEETGRKLAGGQ